MVAGRSAGARVACRTALHLGASGVLALSFPLHPPGKSQSSRAAELGLPLTGGLPVHVIQGARDPFGNPAQVAAAAPGLAGLYAVPGTHTIPQGSATAVATAVRQSCAAYRTGRGVSCGNEVGGR
ncbi:MAG: hypothetical protein IPL45_04085 [Actinomycetales bacterium]|nr:hypothetical protein [Actinomycetales bacterium]